GYEPPSRVVDREMMNLPIFQDNGNFSLALYRQVDESRRLAIRRRVQDDISVARFRADVDGLLTPSTESGFMGRMASTERSFEMVVFSVDAFPESEIEAYVLENPDLFRSAHLSMVTIRGNEREARRILASVDNGELTFEDAARIYSNNIFSDRGGDMGPMMAHELRFHIPDQDVLEAALSVPAGGHSDVLRTAAGWVFFRAESDVQDADLSDPLVMGRVGAYMRSFARGRMENWAIAQAEEFGILANEYGLDGALAQHPELERREFGPVPINFGSVDLFSTLGHDVNELAGSAMNEHFWTVAFSTPLNNASGPVVQGGNVLVLFPTAETEGHYTANAMVASNYTDFWLLNTNDQLLHQHIMNSPRFDDRFIEMHSRLFFRH
ncbi:MAG: peptidylprolyl isomerase, partial [Treponema sp.]|nr:peptidylprolyl isomerase [Treponema sp.]